MGRSRSTSAALLMVVVLPSITVSPAHNEKSEIRQGINARRIKPLKHPNENPQKLERSVMKDADPR